MAQEFYFLLFLRESSFEDLEPIKIGNVQN